VARPDGRAPAELRPLTLERKANPYAEGSCLVRMGGTLVLCTASVEPGVPSWRRGSGKGWVTAEYAMLPRATTERTQRERNGAGGRTQEIQRLIGRSLRASLSGFDFGEYTIRVDCDVLQADGGTRTASVTGAAVALSDACEWLARTAGVKNPFQRLVSAISVGMVEGQAVLDLNYVEDKAAEVDSNFVVAEPDLLVEVQGTGENNCFSREDLYRMMDLAMDGGRRLFEAQRAALGT